MPCSKHQVKLNPSTIEHISFMFIHSLCLFLLKEDQKTFIRNPILVKDPAVFWMGFVHLIPALFL